MGPHRVEHDLVAQHVIKGIDKKTEVQLVGACVFISVGGFKLWPSIHHAGLGALSVHTILI